MTVKMKIQMKIGRGEANKNYFMVLMRLKSENLRKVFENLPILCQGLLKKKLLLNLSSSMYFSI